MMPTIDARVPAKRAGMMANGGPFVARRGYPAAIQSARVYVCAIAMGRDGKRGKLPWVQRGVTSSGRLGEAAQVASG